MKSKYSLKRKKLYSTLRPQGLKKIIKNQVQKKGKNNGSF
jgi:hypothetical protein